MQDTANLAGWKQAASELLGAIWSFLPQLLVAVLLLCIGWALAALLRAASTRFVSLLQGLLARLPGSHAPANRAARKLSPAVIPSLVYWGVMLAFVAAATQALGLQLFAEWLGALLAHLPSLLAAALVLFAGVVTGQLARDLVTGTAASAGLHYPELLGTATQLVLLALSAVIGLELLGLDSTFLTVFAGLVIGMVGAGIALSFGLGARLQVSNLLGAREVREHYSPGQQVRIGQWEGTILDITPRTVILDGPDGQIRIPARLFSEQVSVLLNREEDDV